jgi:glycosyltransferase involved in cell wall biosynthesis
VRICFFAHVDSLQALERIEFYRQDIEILRSLGHEVVIARRLREIPWDADLYYVWWWTWAFQPLLIGRLFRKPVIVTGVLDHPYPASERGFARRPLWQRALMQSALRWADRNVFISRWEADGVPRDYRVRAPRLIPLAVDTEFFRPDALPREDFVLSIIWLESYSIWRKCALEILRAVPAIRARHPEGRFVIVGERQDAWPTVRAEAERLGIGDVVSFPGVVSREEKRRLMQRCRIYLQPTRFEGFGAAILEAMSCGAPVLTNPAGAVAEVVGDAGRYLAGTTPGEIADGVGSLWNDERQLRALSARARERAEATFSYSAKREALRSLLSEPGLQSGTNAAANE